ncbi:Hypothetical protein FKW44_004041, partial [Caligus rogercresseyi]
VTIGCWGFKPVANCKNTSKEPLKCIISGTMGYWGFKPFATCKIRFVHLGPSGSASRNKGYWGFKPFATCKNTSKETPQMPFCAPWALGFRQPEQCGLGFQNLRHFHNNGGLGFKPVAIVKNTSKETLKCHF